MRTHAHTLQTFIHNKRLAIINARRYIFLSSYFCRLQKQRGSGEVTFLTELQLGIIFSLYLLPRFSFFFFFCFFNFTLFLLLYTTYWWKLIIRTTWRSLHAHRYNSIESTGYNFVFTLLRRLLINDFVLDRATLFFFGLFFFFFLFFPLFAFFFFFVSLFFFFYSREMEKWELKRCTLHAEWIDYTFTVVAVHLSLSLHR